MSKKKTLFEKLLNIIPGFHGYRRKEYIREDDRLIRDYMVKLLEDSVRTVEDTIAVLVNNDYSSAERLDEVLRDLRRIMDKIRWSEYGYSPHYNIVKIREEELELMRDLDVDIIEYINSVKEYVEKMRDEALRGNPVREMIVELYKLIKSIEDKWLDRDKIIKGWMGIGEEQ